MADIETASDDYATRFAGATGQWLLSTQEKGVRKLLQKTVDVRSILDVGGGHAQLTQLYLEKHHNLTVAWSAPTCGSRLEPFMQNGNCTYLPANLLALPFPDQHFDLVSSFRLLTHCEQWKELVTQLCRTARAYVIVDYPASQSINIIAPKLFSTKKRFEKNTRDWRSFHHYEVDTAFRQNGFNRIGRYKEFFFPMVLHRMLQRRYVSQLMESPARACGLTYWLGSPVIVLYTRHTEGH